jgi:hypothetical protein
MIAAPGRTLGRRVPSDSPITWGRGSFLSLSLSLSPPASVILAGHNTRAPSRSGARAASAISGATRPALGNLWQVLWNRTCAYVCSCSPTWPGLLLCTRTVVRPYSHVIAPTPSHLKEKQYSLRFFLFIAGSCNLSCLETVG